MRTELVAVTLPRAGSSLLTVPADDANGNFVKVPETGILLLSFFKAGIGVQVTVRTNRNEDGIMLPDRIFTTTANVPYLWLCDLAGKASLYIQSDGMVWIDYDAPCSAAAYLMRG